MEIPNVKSWFDVDSKYGWLLPLFIPLTLWFLATQGAVKDGGLIGQYQPRTNAISVLTNYIETVRQFPGEPVISVFDRRNGNREARLVMRTMNDEDVTREVLTPFVFPGLMAILFAGWCVAISWKFTLEVNHRFRKYADEVLLWGNCTAILWFFGFARIVEFLK